MNNMGLRQLKQRSKRVRSGTLIKRNGTCPTTWDKKLKHSFFFFFFRGKISSYYEREVTIMMILALVAVTTLIVEMDYMEYRDRR